MDLTPASIAATLAAFVDALLPGDDLFPSASSVGAHGLLAERIRQRMSAAAVGAIATRLQGGEMAETVARLEKDEPSLFAFLYVTTSYSYYQNPAVVEAIRALGHDYNDAPQPKGYEMTKFDFTPGINVPMNPVGTFKWTDWIKPVDISALAHLNLPVKGS